MAHKFLGEASRRFNARPIARFDLFRRRQPRSAYAAHIRQREIGWRECGRDRTGGAKPCAGERRRERLQRRRAADLFCGKELEVRVPKFEAAHHFAGAGDAWNERDRGVARGLQEFRRSAGRERVTRARFDDRGEIVFGEHGARAHDKFWNRGGDRLDRVQGRRRAQRDFHCGDAAGQQRARERDCILGGVDRHHRDDGGEGEDAFRVAFLIVLHRSFLPRSLSSNASSRATGANPSPTEMSSSRA